MFRIKVIIFCLCILSLSCGRGHDFFESSGKQDNRSSSDSRGSFPPDLKLPSIDENGGLSIPHHISKSWGGEEFLGSRKLALLAID